MKEDKQPPAHQEPCLFVELPVSDYTDIRQVQLALVAAKNEKRLASDVILMLEHAPVFTLGRRGGLENLRVTQSFLEASGIRVVPAERGGNITYHGPGQLVVYSIFDLHLNKLGVTDLVSMLEEIMIRTAGALGITAERNPKNRGVWVGNTKLGSIGLAVRKGVSYHGMAFNVNISIKPFEWINPCGLKDIGVTSLKKEGVDSLSMDTVRAIAIKHMATVFNRTLKSTTLKKLERLL